MSILKQLYHSAVPANVRLRIYNRRAKINNERIKNDVLSYYKKNPTTDSEIIEALDFLKRNPISALPYSFYLTYLQKNIEVKYDKLNQFPYVMHGKHKLYFKKSWDKERIISSYKVLLAEQDKNSPHCYLSDSYKLESNSVVIDVGAAEGIFAINEMDKISHLYLLEPDPEWVETLKLTYSIWSDKITIIDKFVSDRDNDSCITLDNYFKDFKIIDFLKIDVDGGEQDLINGAANTISDKVNKLVICTYHKADDNEIFSTYLKSKNFKFANSKRYMLYYFFDNFTPPYFRRGIIQAEKVSPDRLI